MIGENSPSHSKESKILVVEDEKGLAKLYKIWLSEDHEVVTTHTAEHAVETIDNSIDVIILDRNLPNKSGDDVLDYITDRDFDCMVAMVTADQPEFEVAQFPIDDYLTKPIERRELQSTVEELSLRSTINVTRQELLALLSRKIALEDEIDYRRLEQAQEYQELCQRVRLLKSELETSPQDISSRHRPDTCPGCQLRWNLDLEGTVGFINLASRVWKCIECGEVVQKPDPSNRSVARGR